MKKNHEIKFQPLHNFYGLYVYLKKYEESQSTSVEYVFLFYLIFSLEFPYITA